MANIHSIVLVGHVLVAFLIIGLVLLQRGKGADAGAAFGAGASGTVFGAKGSANFLSRTTGVMATLFFISSLSLAYFGAQQPVSNSVMDRAEAGETAIKAVPAPAPEAGELPLIPGSALEVPPANPAPAGDSGDK